MYQSKVYEAIEKIDGVEFVNISEFVRDQPATVWRSKDPDYDMDLAIAQGGILKFSAYELPQAGHPNVIRIIITGGH
jgi:hypothetical protein